MHTYASLSFVTTQGIREVVHQELYLGVPANPIWETHAQLLLCMLLFVFVSFLKHKETLQPIMPLAFKNHSEPKIPIAS